MAFSMFSTNASPLAIDFGSSSVKLLQCSTAERPAIVVAGELEVPDSARDHIEKYIAFLNHKLPEFIAALKPKGKRAVIAVPATQTFTQHMQLTSIDGMSRDDLVKGQLQSQMGCHPSSVVVRSADVGTVHRDGQALNEIICFAIARDTVMQYLSLLKRCKLNVAGVHTEAMAIARAFDHLHHDGDDRSVTTLYVDLGWGGTRVLIAHDRKLVFARNIQLGGRHFDQHISQTLHCDLATARAHRWSLVARDATGETAPKVEGATMLNVAAEKHASGGAGTAVAVAHDIDVSGPSPDMSNLPGGLDFTELLDTIADELSMSLRYHHGLFPDRSIDRAIFLGGEARQGWLCRRIAERLHLPSQLGDPLARLDRGDVKETPGLDLTQPQPGWAVPCGLCTAPTDL